MRTVAVLDALHACLRRLASRRTRGRMELYVAVYDLYHHTDEEQAA